MTVLPRKLVFRKNATEITLVAGSRRLRGLAQASKDIKGVTGVLGKTLTLDDQGVLEGLKTLLEQFSNAPGRMTVESAAPDVMGGQAEAGVTAEAIASTWGVPLSISEATGMLGFVRACGALAQAWIILSGNTETTNGGDGQRLSALSTALREQWGTFSDSVARLTGDQGFICLNNALGDHGSVAIATDADEAALICYNPEDMAELHGLWARS